SSPGAAVVGSVAVIAEYVVVIGLDLHRGVAHAIAVLLRNQIFAIDLPVDQDYTLPDLHYIAGQADYALYVGLSGIQRKPEDYDISPVDLLEVVNKFVDEDPLLVAKPGHHAGAFHLHRLVQEDNY